MRVLVVHNRYRSQSPSGENAAVEHEVSLLRSAGHEVATHVEDSDTIRSPLGYASAALGPIYSPGGVRRFRASLSAADPEVVHFHNVFPLVGPASVRAAGEAGVAVVHTVHNYRHSCVNGLHFRDGHACTDCLGTRWNQPAVQHGCYRDSRLQSVPMAVGMALHNGTWRDDVDAMISLTPFMTRRLLGLGIHEERLHTRASWVPDPGYPATIPGSDYLFLGRLDEAKGIRLLLDAWRHPPQAPGRALRIAGDGPLRAEVEAASARDDSLTYLGSLTHSAVAAELRACAAVILPSLWFEGYPLVVAEARAHGRPVVTVSGGAAESIVSPDSGWVCEPSAARLGRTLGCLKDSEIAARGQRARDLYEVENSPATALRSLERIYQEAVEVSTRNGANEDH